MLGNLWLAAALAVSPQVDPGLDAHAQTLLRRPEYEQVVISPDGTMLAIAQHDEGGTTVKILDRRFLTLVKDIKTGRRGEVSDLAWLGSGQLIIGVNRSIGPFAAPIDDPTLYLLDIHKTHGTTLPANFIGTIENDDHHLVVSYCKTFEKNACIFEARRVDTNHMNRIDEVMALAPMGGAQFMIDHAGEVRFAWGADEKERSRLYVREKDKSWKLVNDSDASGIDAFPIGVARNNLSGFLEVQHKDGPDSIERFDFATGARTPLLRDGVSDPLSIIYTPDLVEPLGAMIGTGRPLARFWNAQDPDSIWRMAIDKAFPNSTNNVTSASSDGKLQIVWTQSDRDPGSFYLLDREHRKADLLFRSKPWIDPTQQLSSEPFELKARDGLPLFGFMTLPAGGAKSAPMIVMVHGGPYYVRDDWDFDAETQMLAQHGFAVLRVNFRGSSGFGRPFQEKGYMQWGAAMQDDVTDATRWAIRQGIADPDRICIYGGSYGGYAALMGVVREPALYRCAAGLAGVYDLSKQYKWGDIRRSDRGLDYLRRVIGQDPLQLANRSPSAHAAQITVPILLAHGTLDGRVDIKHAKEMSNALAKAGHPPEYLEYQYEGHGLAAPEHLADFYTHLLQFFDTHLKARTACVGDCGRNSASRTSATVVH
ncbi:alpha/beta fold hydrolase [Rhodanobacter sp. L36]|uniref:alpha/beta hydrolase family protein n=1 Tax=Rhodanobacter sp. L36 TaxID=1747221 RepID=UPI00131C7074|nr:alpha/beta fold hydrolase [Rhodanobacter sp. L36]